MWLINKVKKNKNKINSYQVIMIVDLSFEEWNFISYVYVYVIFWCGIPSLSIESYSDGD